ncbi:hypothetical protein TrVE_jg2557 [Triparma verrucosa]|uniref:Cyclic nucleotide-binding domain-containing protein n=1 Tax=Triparma verrucosa TaxID=1606542 RepID=A0A9W7FJC8_9STRA|nr:hypothetical protein TrVE_jg2557 [Triparma verrucosa]
MSQSHPGVTRHHVHEEQKVQETQEGDEEHQKRVSFKSGDEEDGEGDNNGSAQRKPEGVFKNSRASDPKSARRQQGSGVSRRGSLIEQAGEKIISLSSSAAQKGKRKLQSVVKVLGLHARTRASVRAEEDEEAGGDTLMEMGGAEKKKKTSPKFRDSRRIQVAPKEARGNDKKEKAEKAKVDARKHENLVDQLKLRKKTHTSDEIQAKVMKLSQKQQDDFESTKVLGCVKVWHPTSPPLRYWDLIIAVLVFSQLLMVPFQLAGFPGADSNFMENLNIWIDLIFVSDILVQFNLAVERSEQGYYGDDIDLILDRKKIAKLYLQKWFAIDVLAVSPLFVYVLGKVGALSLKGSETTNLLKLIKAFRLPRLFRLMRIFRVMRTINMRSKEMQWLMYSRYSYLFSVFYLLLTLFLMVHVYACLWYAISGLNIGQRFLIAVQTWFPPLNSDGSYDEDYDSSYKYDSEANNTVFLEATYPMAFHQAVLMIMGESMDLETDGERWMSSVLMIAGSVLMAIVFGEVSMYITNFYASSNMFQKKMTDLYESMEALGLPQSLQERIHLFYKYVWDEHHSIDGRPAILTFVPELSTNLAKEIYLYLFSDMITKVPMFHNRPADVVQHLVLAVQTLIYMPKDYVIVKGEFGQEMFFIQSGKCDVIVEITTALTTSELDAIGHTKSSVKDRLFGKRGLAKTSTFGFAGFKAVNIGKRTQKSDEENEYNLSGRGTPSGSDKDGNDAGRTSNRVSINGTLYKVVEKSVKELDTGSYFGEIALITDSRRTASIRSRTFTELLVLSRDDFMRITENNQDDREEMKAQIRSRYKTDKNVTKLFKKDAGDATANASDELEKQRAGATYARATAGRRQSFLQVHAASGANGGHKNSMVDNEIHELKGQLRTMQSLMLRMNKGMDNLVASDQRRKEKVKRRRKKLKMLRQFKNEMRDTKEGGGSGESSRSSKTASTTTQGSPLSEDDDSHGIGLDEAELSSTDEEEGKGGEGKEESENEDDNNEEEDDFDSEVFSHSSKLEKQDTPLPGQLELMGGE